MRSVVQLLLVWWLVWVPAVVVAATTCPTGYYVLQAINSTSTTTTTVVMTLCTPCPSGYKCPYETSNPIPCGIGQWSNATRTECLPCTCAQGWYCESATSPTDQCHNCLGTESWSNDIVNMPEWLDIIHVNSAVLNPYQWLPRSTASIIAQGMVCRDSTLVACPNGTWPSIISGRSSTSLLLECKPCDCDNGYYCDVSTQGQCTIAMPGFAAYKSIKIGCGKWSESTITSNSWSANSGQSACNECTSCARNASTGAILTGYACLSVTSGQCTNCTGAQGTCMNGVALTCPDNYYGDGRSTCTLCNACDAGTTCSPTYGTDGHSCTVSGCGNGWYCPGQRGHLPCPVGRFSTASPRWTSCAMLTCPIGSYHVSSASSECRVCPIGYYCNDTLTRQPCMNGTHASDLGSVLCSLCTAPPGKYCSLTQMDRTCPKGTFCSGGTELPQPCLCKPGYYCGATGLSQETCKACPESYYCIGGAWPIPLPCTVAGFWCPVNSSSPSTSVCAAGYYCPYTTQPGVGGSVPAIVPVACSCPLGYHCTGGLVMEICMVCPVGSWCANSIATVCDSSTLAYGWYCPLQSTSPRGVPCPAGYYCEPSEEMVVPEPCELGTYSSGAASSCSLCIEGTFTKSIASSGCSTCQAGQYYYDERSSRNITISHVSADDITMSADDTTTRGMKRMSVSSNCKSCPSGKYGTLSGATSVDDCLPCPSGSWSTVMTLSKDTFNVEGAIMRCQWCVPGRYNPETGSASNTSCTECPPGYQCSTFGMNQPTACARGFFNNHSASTACISCDSASMAMGDKDDKDGSTTTRIMVCDQEAMHEPVECPAGYACPSSSTTVACVVGRYSAQGSSACTECAPGYYSWMTASTSCDPCPSGYSTNGASGARQCVPCAAGYASVIVGSPQCSSCNAGTYTNSIASESCLPCPLGQWSTTSTSTSCQLCAAGTFRDSYATQGCVTCSLGYASSYDGLYCSACPSGRYQPENTVGTMDSACLPCNMGTYATSTVASTSCTPCPAGRFGASLGLPSSEGCAACNAGSYNAVPGSVQCTLCDAGRFNSLGAQSKASACLPCPVPSNCPAGSTTSDSICPAGKFIDVEDSLSSAAATTSSTTNESSSSPRIPSCRDCTAGFYCPGGYLKLACTLGHYCPAGISVPEECGLGRWAKGNNRTTNTSEATSWLDCYDCAPGYSCRHGVSRLCSLGSYSSQGNASTCNSCPDGHSAYPGSTHCTECLLGRFAFQTTTSMTADDGDGDSGHEEHVLCRACPLGTFSNQTASHTCMACPWNTWNANSGQTSCQTCWTTASAANGIMNVDEQFNYYWCPRGTAFPMSSDQSSQVPDKEDGQDSDGGGDKPTDNSQDRRGTATSLASVPTMKAREEAAGAWTIMWVAGICSLSFAIILFIYWCTRRRATWKSNRSACKKLLMLVDIFSTEHYVVEGSQIHKNSRALGGMATLLIGSALVMASAIMYVTQALTPSYTERLSKEALSHDVYGDWFVSIQLIGIGGPAAVRITDLSGTNGTENTNNGNGSHWGCDASMFQWLSMPNGEIRGDNLTVSKGSSAFTPSVQTVMEDCKHTWSCQGCVLSSYRDISWQVSLEPHSWVSGVEFTMQFPRLSTQQFYGKSPSPVSDPIGYDLPPASLYTRLFPMRRGQDLLCAGGGHGGETKENADNEDSMQESNTRASSPIDLDTGIEVQGQPVEVERLRQLPSLIGFEGRVTASHIGQTCLEPMEQWQNLESMSGDDVAPLTFTIDLKLSSAMTSIYTPSPLTWTSIIVPLFALVSVVGLASKTGMIGFEIWDTRVDPWCMNKSRKKEDIDARSSLLMRRQTVTDGGGDASIHIVDCDADTDSAEFPYQHLNRRRTGIVSRRRRCCTCFSCSSRRCGPCVSSRCC